MADRFYSNQIISSDLVWRSGDIITVEGTVQLAYGSRLTIEPGVQVIGRNGGSIEVFGDLVAKGTSDSPISMSSLVLGWGNNLHTQPASLLLDYVRYTEGSLFDATGNSGYGKFEISNSSFDDVTGFYIWYPEVGSFFRSNSFTNSRGLSVGTDSRGPSVIPDYGLEISNNNFTGAKKPWNGSVDGAIVVWASYGSPVDIRSNNFFNFDGSAVLELPSGYTSSDVSFVDNYVFAAESYGTNVSNYVLDKADDLSRASVIDTSDSSSLPNSLNPVVDLQINALQSTEQFRFAGWLGDDRVFGSKNGDIIAGAAGSDVLGGYLGNDSVSGGSGNDKVTDSWGTDVLSGDDGDDVIRSFEGGDTINGGSGSDTIYGSRGNDVIYGGDDNDVIYGDTFVFASRGADELSGGNGDDVLQGGFGADTFIFNSGETGNNRIERIDTEGADFEVGIDKIELRGFGETLTSDNILQQWQETEAGAKLTVGDMSLLLTGVSADDLSVNDFVFV